MKRRTKKRIELLELAIKAAKQRYKELDNVHDPKTCPLCLNYLLFNGCVGCPAFQSSYSCNNYGVAIVQIQEHLFAQILNWEQEIERLKKT